jgi:hypothetical protein
VDLASSLVVIVRCSHRRKVVFLATSRGSVAVTLMAASVTVQPKLPLRTVTIVEDHHAKKNVSWGRLRSCGTQASTQSYRPFVSLRSQSRLLR